MKGFKRLRTILLSGCVAVASFCGALLFAPTFDVATANADGALTASEYQTDGASVRVFERTRDESGNITFEGTEKKGIRFHVEMGVGYAYNGTTVVNTGATNERNGSYKLADNFKTYTLIIPTRLLSGDLSLTTDKVMKIDTSEYWFSDDDGNNESVAYVYGVPEKWYTDNFSFRGVICTVAEDGTETVVASTSVSERSLTYVAKMAYNDTIKADDYWGSAALDSQAAPLIKAFVPTYNITYKVGETETTEEVLWGDTPQSVPTEGVKGAWYDTEGSEAIDVTQQMNYSANRTLVLQTTSSTDFVLTGVAAETDFTVDSTSYSGVKVFATLHREAFADKTQMDAKAVNVEHKRGDVVLDSENAVTVQGVWTLEEQNSIGEWQMLLFFALDDSKLENGDQVVIKGNSVFYCNGVMYKLTEDYIIDYTKDGDTKDYGMFLGYLHNSDIKSLTNCAEDNTGNEGKPNEYTVRVEFYDDVMINGEFTFEFGPDSDATKYKYPVYIQCGEDESKLVPVSGGRYYWNEGNHKILELIGAGEYENKVFGWHDGDELFGAPGMIIKQNGGYYIFEDEMYGYFKTNGLTDSWGTELGDWLVGEGIGEYATSEFATQGSFVGIEDDGTPDKEFRINTVTHWFPEKTEKVNMLTTEKMSDSAPYAVYRTATDGTQTEVTEVRYHGTVNPNGGYYQILGFFGLGEVAVGDTVTIAAGTRFWLGTEYYTVTDEITYYYNGSYWLQNFDVSTIRSFTQDNFSFKAQNVNGTDVHLQLTGALEGLPTTDQAWTELTVGQGGAAMNGTAATSMWYYRWDANTIFLVARGFVGENKFDDKLVLAGNTTLWVGDVCYQLPEEGFTFRYTGYTKVYNTSPNPFSESHEWMLDTGVNVNVSNADVGTIGNHTETWCNNNEVRFHLDANTAQNLGSYSGVAAINTNKPAIYNGTEVIDGQYYGGSSDIIAVVGAFGTKDGDYVIIPAGSVWWTKTGGTVTITDEIIATYVNGAWVKGDLRAYVDVTAATATVSGIENIAVGQTYSITITPHTGYAVTGITINGVSTAVRGDDTYSFTAQANNTIVVETEEIQGYKVTFNMPTEATVTVDGNAITDGGAITVEKGASFTFTVTAAEGYKIASVSQATDNGDGTYTLAPAADTTVTVTTEKLYKVSYDGQHTTITVPNYGTVENSFSTWVDNGTTVAFTVAAVDGYTLMSVTGATKNEDGSYSVTVNGADLTVTATALSNDAFVDITGTTETERLAMEDRAWGVTEDIHAGGSNEVYVALLDKGIQQSNGTYYFNTAASVSGTWYVGNDAIITANGGVDIMEYIYVNGQSARSLITANANGDRNANSCTCWLSNPAAYPVYVESTTGSGLMMRFSKKVFGTEFTITIKAGFRITNSDGSLVAVTKDIDFKYSNGTITKTIANA